VEMESAYPHMMVSRLSLPPNYIADSHVQ